MAKQQLNSKLKSDGSIATVLEEDEELGRSYSSEDGLQSILNDDDILESSDDGHERGVIRNDGRTNKLPKPISFTPKRQQRSIQETLIAMDAPWELRQATALLLQSSLLDESTARLLTSDILDQSLEVEPTDEDHGGTEELEDKNNEDSKHAKEISDRPGQDAKEKERTPHTSSAENQSTPRDVTIVEEAAPSSESLSLQSASKNEELLRPSIFTMQPSFVDES